MFRKIFILFRIARRLAISDAVEIISKIHQPPIIIKTLLNIFSFSFSKKNDSPKKSDEDKLCESIQGMGTTFIKLGKFLATRPDIIGEEISKKIEKLQDRLPPFSMQDAKNILKESLICVLEKAYVMLIKVVMVLAIILKDTISNGRL